VSFFEVKKAMSIIPLGVYGGVGKGLYKIHVVERIARCGFVTIIL
jgi:hypothetical protein